MSHEFPRRPKTAKGAIVAVRPNSRGPIIDLNGPTFIFEYNPETLTRIISSRSDEALRADGKKPDSNSIVELINLNLELDATDQLEHPNQNIGFIENGLHPALAALESIMHSQSETENSTPSVTIFCWGPNRVVPVWLDSLKVTEEAFDPYLNPIRARIELSMRVRDLSELRSGSSAYAICASHLDHRRMFTQLYSGKGINREFFEQVSSSIQRYLAMGTSQSKEDKKKRQK